MFGQFIAEVTKTVKRFGLEIPCLAGRPARPGEKAEAERELVIACNRFASSSDYDARKQLAGEMAAALGRFLALE
jgi:hypothetical protein